MGRVSDSLRSGPSLLGLLFYIDTNIVDALSAEAGALRRLDKEGWITLFKTDMMDIELSAAPTTELPRLFAASAPYPESFGPEVPGESDPNSSVRASQEDTDRVRDVFTLLYPGADWTAPRPNNRRDAMHVATAIRYGGRAFVTHDAKILKKDTVISQRFNGFRIWTARQALAEAAARVGSTRELYRREPHRGLLPTWPVSSDLDSLGQ
jgi:hypothetical protein